MDSLCQHLCINGVIFLHKFIRRHRSCWAAELTLLWYQIVVATRTLCVFHASPHAWWVLLDHACVIRMPKKRVMQDGWLYWAAVLSWCVKLDKSENHSEREGCQKTRDSVFRLKKKWSFVHRIAVKLGHEKVRVRKITVPSDRNE